MITRKKLCFGSLLNLSLIFALLTACNGESESEADGSETGDEAEAGGELSVAYAAQPLNLDVHEVGEASNRDIMRHVWEPLVTMDSEQNVEPMLAESFEQSEDGTEVEFQLREGVLFHNGEEMTAEDVEASMNKWLAVPRIAETVHEDAHAEATDDYTVVLHLQEPNSIVLDRLAFNTSRFPAIMPKEIIEDAGDTGVTEYVGTGPFEFVEWAQDQHIHLQKFDDYQSRDEPADGLAGAREALVDDIYFEFVSDSSTRISGIQTGEYDIAHSIPYDNVEQLEADPNLENHIYPSSSLFAHFNNRDGFFTEPEARRALAASIDKEEMMIAGYTSDDFYVMNNHMTMYHMLEEELDEEERPELANQNDPEVMSEYLDDIGYDGEEITVMVTRDYEDQYNAAVVLQQQMEQLGLNVNLELYDYATLMSQAQDESAYDMTVLSHPAVADPTLLGVVNPESSSSGWGEQPDAVDEILELPPNEDGEELYEELLTWFGDYVPSIKIGDYESVDTTRSSVDNFQIQEGLFLWNVSKDEE